MLSNVDKRVMDDFVLRNCVFWTPPINDINRYFNDHLGLKNFMDYIEVTRAGNVYPGEEKTAYSFKLKQNTPDIIKTEMLMECGYTMKQAMEAMR